MLRKITPIWIVTGIMLSVSNLAWTQNAKEVLAKLNTTYANKSYQMNYGVKMVNGENNAPINAYSGMIAKQGRNLHLNTPEELTIVNKNFHVYVNKLEKIIFINEVPKEKGNQSLNPLSDLDSLLNNKNIKLISSTGSFYTIEILLDEKKSYKKAILKINKKYQLISCTYFLTANTYPFDKIEINYTHIKVEKKINNQLFSTKSVLKKIKNKVVTTGAYKNYELIDNRTIKKD